MESKMISSCVSRQQYCNIDTIIQFGFLGCGIFGVFTFVISDTREDAGLTKIHNHSG